jgi:hypothetical protein
MCAVLTSLPDKWCEPYFSTTCSEQVSFLLNTLLEVCNLLNSVSISVNQLMYVNSESCLGNEISSLMIQTTVIQSGSSLFEMHSEEDFTWGHMVWHCVSLSVLHYHMPQVLEKEGEPVPFLQWRLLATLIYAKKSN